MADLVFVAIIVAFFALAALFVKGCDLIIGSDDEAFAGASAEAGTPAAPERTAA